MEKFKATLMDETAVTRALKRISHEILEKNNGTENLCIIGIKRRGVSLAKIIADNIYNIEGIKVPCGEIDITYYRDDLSVISDDPVIHGASLFRNRPPCGFGGRCAVYRQNGACGA